MLSNLECPNKSWTARSLAVGIPVSGWIADRFGTRRVFATAIAVFTIASVLCGLCQSAGQMIAARILQGASAALMMRVESFRSKGNDAGAVTKPPASGDNFFRAVNDLAMKNLGVWVPHRSQPLKMAVMGHLEKAFLDKRRKKSGGFGSPAPNWRRARQHCDREDCAGWYALPVN